jgi:WD40 repeat protein
MYGYDSIIELWTPTSGEKLLRLETNHSRVTAIGFLADGSSFVSAGQDGYLSKWLSDGTKSSDIGRLRESIASFQRLPNTSKLIARGRNGNFWKIENSEFLPIANVSDEISRWLISNDGRWMAVGTTAGYLQIYDTATFVLYVNMTFESAIRDVAFVKGDRIAVAAGSNLYVFAMEAADRNRKSFDKVPVLSPRVSFQAGIASIQTSPDDEWLAIMGRDGALWFYAIDENQWLCAQVGSAELIFGQFATDSKHYLATDSDGRVLLVDVTGLNQASSLNVK